MDGDLVPLGSGEYYPIQYILEHMRIEDHPQILGWSGAARCGSTAMLLTLASQPWVGRAYFQPEKTILRYGRPDFVIPEGVEWVAMKEVWGPLAPEENYDAIDLLLKAGIPAENIRWIFLLRDPLHAFASWFKYTPRTHPYVYAVSQEYTLKLYWRYRALGFQVIPFVYDLFDLGEQRVFEILLAKLGLADKSVDLTFDTTAITAKLILGEAEDPTYFREVIVPILDRGRFEYVPPQPVEQLPISAEQARQVEYLCLTSYLEFASLAKKELGL